MAHYRQTLCYAALFLAMFIMVSSRPARFTTRSPTHERDLEHEEEDMQGTKTLDFVDKDLEATTMENAKLLFQDDVFDPFNVPSNKEKLLFPDQSPRSRHLQTPKESFDFETTVAPLN